MKRQRLSYADWSTAEYAAAGRCLLRGQVASGPYPALLAQRLTALFRPSTVYPLSSGSTALGIALAILRRRRPERAEVLVPAYICPSVPDAVRAAGLVPRTVAVGADLNLTAGAVARALGPATLAVIAPHMYGCPADIGAIERACDGAGVFLIDDAAQVIGESSAGRPLGSFGAMGILSFAQSKTVATGVLGSGGALLVNRPEFDAEARAACAQLAPPRQRLGAFVHFLWDYQWKRYTGHSGYYLERLRARLGRPLRPAGAARISNLEAAIALAQLDRLALLRAERIRVAEAYHAALAALPSIGFPQYAPGRLLARVMLALPEGTDLAAFRAALDARVETRLGYLEPVDAARPDPQAAALAARLFGVPFRIGMHDDEIRAICRIVGATLDHSTPSHLLPLTHS